MRSAPMAKYPRVVGWGIRTVMVFKSLFHTSSSSSGERAHAEHGFAMTSRLGDPA
jgi:hypothetical protein